MYKRFFSGKDLDFVGRSYEKKLEALFLKTNKCHIFPKIASEKKKSLLPGFFDGLFMNTFGKIL